jgi:hypothetical protein
MASRRVIVYEGGTYTSSTANDANTIVERDNSKAIPADILNAVKQLIVGGVLDVKGVAVTASQPVDASATFYEGDATAGAIVLTLPPVATVIGRVFVTTKTDAGGNAVGFKGSGSENIDGANTKNTTTQFTSVRIRANAGGTAWLSF